MYIETGLKIEEILLRNKKEIVKDMDSDEFRNNVTNIVGGGVGIAGGAMMIGGLLLAPFTAGFGLALAGVGAGEGAAGGVGNLAGDVISKNYALKKCNEADDLIQDDQKQSVNLEHAEEKLTEAIVILKKNQMLYKQIFQR